MGASVSEVLMSVYGCLCGCQYEGVYVSLWVLVSMCGCGYQCEGVCVNV